MKIELDAPNVGELEKSYLSKVIDSGFVSTFGPFVPDFEDKFAKFVGAKKAVSTQSGTAALHVALYELGIGALDEVIVPAVTFVATVNPVVYVGATPVFADIDPVTWNILPSHVEKLITKKTKAIIPVHLYGNPCKMDEILAIAKKFNIAVIEDATESLGATFQGKQTGTFGEIGCYSFNGNKIITTGGGGMVVCRDENRSDHIKFLVNQARDEKIGYYHPEIGFNYRMTNLEAGFGLAQMERLSGFAEKKIKYRAIYKKILGDIDFIRFQEPYPEATSSDWFVSLRFLKKTELSEFQKLLKAKEIPTRRVFYPIVDFEPYKKYKKESYKNSFDIYESSLCLPSSTLNTEEMIEYTARSIRELCIK